MRSAPIAGSRPARAIRGTAALLIVPVIAGLGLAACARSAPPVSLGDAGGPAATIGATGPAATGAATASGTGADADAPAAAARALWTQVLDVFAAAPDQRAARLAPLAGRVPAELATTADAFVPPAARTLTSRASYQRSGAGRITVTDCATSSARSLLGDATAGFRAEVTQPDPAGPWMLATITLVPNCVPRADAEAALAAYDAFHAGETRLWAALDPADPTLQLTTAGHKASLLASFEEHRTYGWRETRAFSRQTAEVVGVREDGAVLIGLCTTYTADTGVYDRSNRLVTGSARTGQWHQRAALVPQERRWLFDGYTNTGPGCAFAPTDQAATLL